MKNLLLFFLLSGCTTLSAQSLHFEAAIELNIRQISAETSAENWQTLGLAFAKITAQHPNEWLANYYTAYAYMQLAGTYSDQTLPIVANHLDIAQTAIEQANKLSPNNAEILVLQGFIFVARIWESPYLNGGLYGRKISKLFKKAIEIEEENPRAYYLKGLLTFHTPRFVGGGKERAKPWLLSAKEKFEAYNFKSAILPYWGADLNEKLLETCGKNEDSASGQ